MKARRKGEKEWEGSNVWRNVYNFLEVVKDINSQIQEAQMARQTNRKKKKIQVYTHNGETAAHERQSQNLNCIHRERRD